MISETILNMVMDMYSLWRGRCGASMALARNWSGSRLERSLPPNKMTTTSLGVVRWAGRGCWGELCTMMLWR